MAKYTVKQGDTLYKIASRLSGMSGSVVSSYISALVSINNLPNADKIFVGQVITYPDAWRSNNSGVTIDQPMGPPVPASLRRSSPGRRRYATSPGGFSSGVDVMGMLKNPMILGAIALGLIVLFTSKK